MAPGGGASASRLRGPITWVSAVVTITGLYSLYQYQYTKQLNRQKSVGKPELGGPFTLMDVDGKRVYLRLLARVVPYWRTFALGILSMIVLGVSEPALAALLKPTFDGSFVEKDLESVGLLSMLVIVLFVVRGAATFATTMALTSQRPCCQCSVGTVAGRAGLYPVRFSRARIPSRIAAPATG